MNNLIPKSFNNYHEPFLGGGSVFFHLKKMFNNSNKSFFISDLNEDLINVYLQIRDNPLKLIDCLKTFENSKDFYYSIRQVKPIDLIESAAHFIYLNRTSFNGIYRVNSKGIYNVPYGKRENVDIVTEDLLLKVSNILKNVSINSNGFEDSLENIKEGDLVFLDPPYTIAHENNGFIEYNQTLFAWEDQLRLKKYILQLSEIGAYYILSNAYHESILELYAETGVKLKFSRNSQVGGRNKTRGKFNELVITNV